MMTSDKNGSGPAVNAEPELSNRRRRLLGKIAVGGVAAAAIPMKWSKPVVDTVLLPVHAQTSPATGVRVVSGGGSGSNSQSGRLAPANSFANKLANFFIKPAHAVGAFSDYCVEIDVEETDGEVTAVTVTKYCYFTCGTDQWFDQTAGPLSLTFDSVEDEWSRSGVGCCTLRIFDIDTSSAVKLAGVIYGGIEGTIVPGDSCDCSCEDS